MVLYSFKQQIQIVQIKTDDDEFFTFTCCYITDVNTRSTERSTFTSYDTTK